MDKEKTDRILAGQCFVCGKTGHLSYECPTKWIVSTAGSKPPGATAFNVKHVEENSADDLVKVLDSLPIGAMTFDDLEVIHIHPSNKWMELSVPGRNGETITQGGKSQGYGLNSALGIVVC